MPDHLWHATLNADVSRVLVRGQCATKTVPCFEHESMEREDNEPPCGCVFDATTFLEDMLPTHALFCAHYECSVDPSFTIVEYYIPEECGSFCLEIWQGMNLAKLRIEHDLPPPVTDATHVFSNHIARDGILDEEVLESGSSEDLESFESLAQDLAASAHPTFLPNDCGDLLDEPVSKLTIAPSTPVSISIVDNPVIEQSIAKFDAFLDAMAKTCMHEAIINVIDVVLDNFAEPIHHAASNLVWKLLLTGVHRGIEMPDISADRLDVFHGVWTRYGGMEGEVRKAHVVIDANSVVVSYEDAPQPPTDGIPLREFGSMETSRVCRGIMAYLLTTPPPTPVVQESGESASQAICV